MSPVLGLWWAIGFTSLLAFALAVAFAPYQVAQSAPPRRLGRRE
jgi:hypothetical protein